MCHITRLHRLARLSSAFALLLSALPACAQAPAPRIRGPIELTPSVPLAGSLNPRVRLSDDLGPLAPGTLIRGVTLVFKRSTAQQADLQQLLAQQTDPSSPLFHHWLTPEDFAARFGVADADIAATESWLQAHGFTLDTLSPGPSSHPDSITFSGTAAQIQQAFGAQLHRFRSGNDADAELHFAPATELSLPPALAPLTAAILHLSDFRPRPNFTPVRPFYTTAGSQSHFLSPPDIATMYDLAPLFASVGNFPGTGQSIAVVGQSFVPTASGSAVSNFQTLLGGGSASITPVLMPGTGVEAAIPGDEAEADIDLEYSSGIARSASIFFVFTGTSPNYNAFDALAFAITQDIAPVISVSYGTCESLVSSTDLEQYNAILQQAAAQGQTIVVASGDSGATACSPFSSSSGVSLTQQQALAASFPASSPFVTAVGGTQLASGTYTAGISKYWSSAGAADNKQSLVSYVPEVAWNEDTSSFGIAASGGGSSNFFPRPSWQAGVPGIPSGSFRLLPDVALESSIASPGYILCTDDQSFTGASSDCAGGTVQNSNNRYILAGGTSFAAPLFAGFVAVLNQYQHTLGQGNLNPTLYSLAAQPSVYASAFHDITSGTTACVAGDGNCGTPGQSVYAATTGYDMATGLGSLDFTNLATAWPAFSTGGLTPTTTFFSITQTSAAAGATVPVQILVSTGYLPGGPTLPTGSLSIFLDGKTVNPALALGSDANNQGSVNYSFVAPAQAGAHLLVARYSGDATHLPSAAAYAITVGNVLATGGVSFTAGNITMSNNSTGSAPITITPNGGYNGELTWSLSVSGSLSQTLCYIVKAPLVSGPTTGTLYIGAGTTCSGPLPSVSFPSSGQRASAPHPPSPRSHNAPAAATLAALLLFGILPLRRRRKISALLSTALLAIAAATLTGCGGGSSTAGSGPGGNTTPQPQVYTVTLEGKDSVNTAIAGTTTFTLTVNN
ncbi:MAG TPA: protease pro-enzyme activation domain-containing protein [Acidobacteriaceae bacterium]|nr:protease pro-enzyme activation domain-containing protein [Acidobacteriaceae bacterium]